MKMKITQPFNDHRLTINEVYLDCVNKEYADYIMSLVRKTTPAIKEHLCVEYVFNSYHYPEDNIYEEADIESEEDLFIFFKYVYKTFNHTHSFDFNNLFFMKRIDTILDSKRVNTDYISRVNRPDYFVSACDKFIQWKNRLECKHRNIKTIKQNKNQDELDRITYENLRLKYGE